MFRLEEGVQVDETLDVQAHLVFAVDGVQADEDTAVYQCQLLLGAAGREHEIGSQVVYNQHMPLVLPAGVQRRHLKAVGVQEFTAMAFVQVQAVGQALDEAAADLPAAIPQLPIKQVVVVDGDLGLRKEAPIAKRPHDTGEPFGKHIAAFVQGEPQARAGQEGLGVCAGNLQIQYLIILHPAESGGIRLEDFGQRFFVAKRMRDNLPLVFVGQKGIG